MLTNNYISGQNVDGSPSFLIDKTVEAWLDNVRHTSSPLAFSNSKEGSEDIQFTPPILT